MKAIIYTAIFLLFFNAALLNAQKKQNNNNNNRKTNDTLEVKTSEVVISALRYPEYIMEVPLSISLIKKSDLNEIRGIGIDEPLNLIPGVLAQSRFGGTDIRLTIRGFGARGAGDRSNSGTSRGLRFYIDGIPETEPDGRTALDLFDMSIMDHLEVIRSNASAIWGNAAGGVLTYTTLPNSDKTFFDAGYLFGSYGLRKFNINAASRLDSGMVKVSFVRHLFDGYRQNSSGNRSLLNVSIRTGNPYLTFHVTGVENFFYIPGPLTQSEYDLSPESANTKYLKNKEHRENKVLRIGANFVHRLSSNQEISAMAFAAPKYLQRSERGTYRDFNRYHIGTNINYKNIFSLSDIVNTLLIGIDDQYQNGSAIFHQLDSLGNRSSNMTANKAEGANNFGAFLQDEIFMGDLSLLFGLRYDNILYNNNDFMTAKSAVKKFDKLTPKLALSYQLDEMHYIFANMGGGVEVPAGNETDPSPYLGEDTVYLFNPLLEPIKSTTFEIGSKNSEYFSVGFIRSIQYDLSLFYINITNDIIPYQGGKFYFTAGKTDRFGAEGRISARTVLELDFDCAVTYMQAKYKEYIIDSVYFNQSKAGLFADYSGNKTAGIPDLTVNIGLNYTPAFFDKLSISATLQHVGDYFADDANQFKVPSYLLLNGKISYKFSVPAISSMLNVFAGVNNLLDRKFVSSAFINPEIEKNTGLPYYLEPGLPRNFYAGISYSIE